MTSRFWERLGAEHGDQLAEHGFDEVKRVQALRYFTWRWTPGRIAKGEQGRYLLRRAGIRSLVRSVAAPAVLRAEAWQPAEWTLVDRVGYTVATRLLWDVAARDGDPDVIALGEPQLGHPFPVRWRGRLISQDLANTALELSSIRESLDGSAPDHVVEIGAGYGRTAHAILSLYSSAAYTIVDIPPALDIARWYLTTLFPDRELTFVDATAGGVDVAPFDLGVSISSLQEMTADQVATYLELLDRRGRPGATVYLKQWLHWRNPEDQIELTLDAYQLSDRWTRLFRRRTPVQTKFGEVAWRLGDQAATATVPSSNPDSAPV